MSDYTENFERAWEAYPKRNGRKVGKKPAFTVWQRLTAEEKRTAYADIQKRNRQGTWGKYIKDMERYLKHHGWEDEIEAPQRDLLTRTSNDDAPKVPELPWHHRMLNRLGVVYMRRAYGLPEVESALKIKHEVLHECQELVEDLPEDKTERAAAIREAAETMADLFLLRLDLHYKLALREPIMRAAK